MISDERIERAALEVAYMDCGPVMFNDVCAKNKAMCVCRNEVRAVLTSDAPEIAAAEIRGLEMARKISGDGHFRKNPGTGAGAIADGILFHMQIVRGEIDARIAELKAKTEPGK